MQLEVEPEATPREEIPLVALDLHLAGRMLAALAAADACPEMATRTIGLLAEQLEAASVRLRRVTATLERKAPKIAAPVAPARPHKKPAKPPAPARPPRSNGTASAPPAASSDAAKPTP